jgi:hypothetical protein
MDICTAWKCVVVMKHGYAAQTCRKDMQHRNTAWTCSKGVKHEPAACTYSAYFDTHIDLIHEKKSALRRDFL